MIFKRSNVQDQVLQIKRLRRIQMKHFFVIFLGLSEISRLAVPAENNPN